MSYSICCVLCGAHKLNVHWNSGVTEKEQLFLKDSHLLLKIKSFYKDYITETVYHVEPAVQDHQTQKQQLKN